MSLPGRYYRHHKGGVYRLMGEATHTETKEVLVVYADADGYLWARPRPMFTDGRFALLHDNDRLDAPEPPTDLAPGT